MRVSSLALSLIAGSDRTCWLAISVSEELTARTWRHYRKTRWRSTRLYLALVKCAVRDSGRNCLYFYPDAYLDEAQKRGIADKTEELRKGKRFMTFFCLVIFVVLIAVIAGWNGVKDFHTACFEADLFLVVMNWFDGFVIDLLWGRPQQDLAYRGHGGRPLWEAVADGLHQAQCGHSAVPSCRGRGRRDRCADRQNLTAEEKRFPSHWLGNLFRIAARCRG